MSPSFEDYQDLSGVGFQGGSSESTAPEDEFFHSVYIAGKKRKNHINIEEQAGKIQIRGVAYNLDEINMIITHTKDILAKIKTENRKDTIECFSYKDGAPPWHGTSKLPSGNFRPCPQTSAERAVDTFCNTCKAQILVAGIYCDKNGSPILTEEKKPIFIFIRGKGTKYSNISEYLNNRYNEDLSPIFEPVTEQSKSFEKSVVNNKRFVVNLSIGEVSTQYGNDAKIFILNKGEELPKDVVLKILKLSKDTLEKFNDKFDWSKRKGGNASSYGSAASLPSGIMAVDNEETKSESTEQEQKPEPKKNTFSFDDISI